MPTNFENNSWLKISCKEIFFFFLEADDAITNIVPAKTLLVDLRKITTFQVHCHIYVLEGTPFVLAGTT